MSTPSTRPMCPGCGQPPTRGAISCAACLADVPPANRRRIANAQRDVRRSPTVRAHAVELADAIVAAASWCDPPQDGGHR